MEGVSDKVLAMSLMTGRHLEDFLARRPSQKLRNELGAHLFELFYFQVLKIEALHADPHWGNYLFTDDASISLVDFGCVKYLSPESVAYLRSVFLYPGETDSVDFRRLLEKYYDDRREVTAGRPPGANRFRGKFLSQGLSAKAGEESALRFQRHHIPARLSA